MTDEGESGQCLSQAHFLETLSDELFHVSQSSFRSAYIAQYPSSYMWRGAMLKGISNDVSISKVLLEPGNYDD